MPIKRRVYDVHLNPEGFDPMTSDPLDEEGVTTHRVLVIHADQMFGEREAMKRGITFDQTQNLTSVIVWCAAKRQGIFTGTYEEWRDSRLLDIANPEVAQHGEERTPDGAVEVDVPPTSEPSPSASGSPATSPASESTGSTPTSTSTW